jgi:hypothetical protein
MMFNLTHEDAPRKPVTLPIVRLRACPDVEHDLKIQAQRFIEIRTVKAGAEAWQAIDKAESFEAWKKIGAALSVGKQHALNVTGANRAWGQHYSREFCKWMTENHFSKMPKSLRSVAIELHENIDAITAWRSTLPERQRQRLNGPQQNLRRWRKETADKVQHVEDMQKAAAAAWRRFMRCVNKLSAEDAMPLWQTVQAEAAVHA